MPRTPGQWLELQRRPDQADVDMARAAAVEVLLARLPRAPLEKREGLRARIAAIRAGTLDNAPEVKSAYLVLQRCNPTPDQVRGDEEGIFAK